MSTTAQIIVSSKEMSGEDASDLLEWLRTSRIRGAQGIEKVQHAPERDKMGVDPATILTIILSSAAAVELVKCIHVWITTRRPRASVTIESEGKTVRIESDSGSVIEALAAKAKDMLE